jgi:hypothetical protein
VDIREGSEIFLDYGPDYFADRPDGCPCLSCHPQLSSPTSPPIHLLPTSLAAESPELEKNHKKQVKQHQRQKERKQERKQFYNPTVDSNSIKQRAQRKRQKEKRDARRTEVLDLTGLPPMDGVTH